jgi:hypothetical protein
VLVTFDNPVSGNSSPEEIADEKIPQEQSVNSPARSGALDSRKRSFVGHPDGHDSDDLRGFEVQNVPSVSKGDASGMAEEELEISGEFSAIDQEGGTVESEDGKICNELNNED